MSTWLITGISRGLGLALAKAVLAQGDTVIGTTRDGKSPLEDAARLHIIEADLANGGTPERVVREAFALAPTIDVIVNNAGHGLLGAMETSTDAELEGMFAVDVFAPIRVMRAALPHLRRQGRGQIVNITSIAGRAPTVGASLYSAAKYALEGVSAALALEVAPLGIKVMAVAPGAFRTDFLSAHSIRRSGREDAAYAETIGRSSAHFTALHGKQAGDPERAAQAIVEAVRAAEPPRQLLLGSDALRRARERLDAMIDEMAAWEAVTVSTDFKE